MSGNVIATSPAHFNEWLSGRCEYSDPPVWACRFTRDGLTIKQSWKTTWVYFCFFVSVLAFSMVLLWLSHDEDLLFMILPLIIATILGAVALGIFGPFFVVCVVNRFRGPYFVYSSLKRRAWLNREHLTFPVGEILGWRLVSGNWFGPPGAQKRRDWSMSELQLIVRAPNGAMAYALVGGKLESIEASARQIAQAMNLPIELITQSQGRYDPPTSSRVLWWRSRGL